MGHPPVSALIVSQCQGTEAVSGDPRADPFWWVGRAAVVCAGARTQPERLRPTLTGSIRAPR